ncbi:MAG: tetratricopeptide repeat protein [Pseudomonadota bacterium]
MNVTSDNTAAKQPPLPSAFQLGPWLVDPEAGELTGDDANITLEPQLMTLLSLLAANPGDVLSRSVIETVLWPNTIVGDDTLARAVSRLRRALDDSAQSPRYIETLPKRGYRLIAPVTLARTSKHPKTKPVRFAAIAAGIVIAGIAALWLTTSRVTAPPDPSTLLIERADDLYMRFTRADNEAAIGLYERVLAEQPDNAGAQAGLANALVQRVVRWPKSTGATVAGADSLSDALEQGLTQGPEAQAVLARATAMAERAVRLDPSNPDALKSLAFTVTAQGNLERAEAIYKQAIALDDDAWPSLINLGEIESIRGNTPAAVRYFERAYEAMARAYTYEPQRVGPWQVAMGVAIGEKHEQLGDSTEAELWYRRTLAAAPYEPEATVRLARLLAAAGDATQAAELCRSLSERVGDYPGCNELQ